MEQLFAKLNFPFGHRVVAGDAECWQSFGALNRNWLSSFENQMVMGHVE